MGGEGANFSMSLLIGERPIVHLLGSEKTHPQNFLVCSPSSNVTILYFDKLENGEGFFCARMTFAEYNLSQ